MATPVTPLRNSAPYAAPLDETAASTDVTATDGPVEVNITLHLVGTVAQVQADWATLIAVATFTASTVTANYAVD